MKNTYYYIVTLVVLLFMVAPAKAVSEAEFGKLHKTYILHTDGSQEMRVQKELTLFTHTAMNRLYGESVIVYYLSGLLGYYPSGVSSRTGCVRADRGIISYQGVCAFGIGTRKQTFAL